MREGGLQSGLQDCTALSVKSQTCLINCVYCRITYYWINKGTATQL